MNTPRTLMGWAAGALVLAAAGCSSSGLRAEPSSALNTWLARGAFDTAVNNAILSQHTLYDYHFERGAATLNDLGRRDLAVLSEHFLKYPGTLNVRRGNAPAALHHDRIQSVLAALSEAGVATDRVAMSDGLPGGEGISSERVLVILEEPEPQLNRAAAASVQPMTGTGVQP